MEGARRSKEYDIAESAWNSRSTLKVLKSNL